MGKEIERKFLIDREKLDYSSYPSKEIVQGYLSVNPVIRVRRDGEDYYLTYKGSGMMVREEYNLYLTKESFEHLLKKADGNLIEKRRYKIPYKNYTIELDEFHGKLSGLIMAEIEFPSEDEAKAFNPPDFFLREVTNDPDYHNSNMINR